MLNSLHSNSLVIDKNIETVITFNPFEIMGVAFLSLYSLEGGICNIVLKIGDTVINRCIKDNYVLIDFTNPILLDVNSKLKLIVDKPCFIHYHIFTPSELEKTLYKKY